MIAQKEFETAKKIAEAVALLGGRAYFVGGCVRDSLMGLDSKDVDIEVHGISPQALENILDGVGKRLEYGKSFGVYSLSGTSLDIAMPRRESAIGIGHKDFKIEVDPYLGTKGAAKRRDFTINALMQDVLTGEITDHFGGKSDLEKGILRHVSDDSFAEDPLRVLRAAQFAARFGFDIDGQTIVLCRTMPLSALPCERVFAELEKALIKADRPSVFFEVLQKAEQLSVWFDELGRLIGIPQNEKYHTEGDVWVHTMMVLDEAAKLRCRADHPLPFMLSALVHDLGKISATTVSDGVVHAYGHETKGLRDIENFISRLTSDKSILSYVLNLCALHMKPNTMAHHNSSVKSTNKLFDDAAAPNDLILLALADSRGKTSPDTFVDTEPFLFERLEIYREYMSRPYVTGKDLIELGFSPSESFSDILGYAHKLRLAGIPKDSALKQTLSYARKNLK